MSERLIRSDAVEIQDVNLPFAELQERVEFYQSEYTDGFDFRLVRENDQDGKPTLKVRWFRYETDEEYDLRIAEEERIAAIRKKEEEALRLERIDRIHELEEELEELYSLTEYRNRFVDQV
jgi:hypothetical protein